MSAFLKVYLCLKKFIPHLLQKPSTTLVNAIGSFVRGAFFAYTVFYVLSNKKECITKCILVKKNKFGLMFQMLCHPSSFES